MKKKSILAKAGLLFLILFILSSLHLINAQPGSLDATFNPGTGATTAGFSDEVSCVALQSDGKILIGGLFTSYNGTARNRIARLHSDGTLDVTFNPGTGASAHVTSIAVQSDGKILIGGSFTSYNGTSRNRIARLNGDGSIDASFDPGTGFNNSILFSSIIIQNDGKILVAGSFTSYNGTSRNRITRLNSDGSLDTGFDPGAGANDIIRHIALQSDGKIIIGGDFTSYDGTSRNYIARLNSNGSLDTGFDPGTGANSSIYALAIQSDGKILIGGDFTSYNGNSTGKSRIARVNSNGSVDALFNPTSGLGANDLVYSIVVQDDGKILIGGRFSTYNGLTRNRIVRFNPGSGGSGGIIDSGFDTEVGVGGGWVSSIAIQNDGRIIIGGFFTSYDGTSRNGIARIIPFVLPTLSTAEISYYNSNAAGCGGEISNDGGSVVTARGVCWSTSPAPTIADDKTTDGSGTGSFTSNLSGLSPNTTYYVRAYATNTAGTAYGAEISFTTTGMLTTIEPTSITNTGARSGGQVDPTAILNITEKGVCYSTSPGPTTANNTATGFGGSDYLVNINGLTSNTTYYVRAYIIVFDGSFTTFYGNELSFTTLAPVLPSLTTASASSITISSAVSGGTISTDGGASVTARGVCWSTSPNPTTADSKTTDGSGTGSFTSDLSGLLPGTTYYVRAYATNSVGTAYGDQQNFTTLLPVPVLTTASVTSITATTAMSGGNITDDNGYPVTERGVCWSTSPNPTTADNKTSDGTGTGSFASSITGLSAGTTYYVRAYAVNAQGTAYGNEESFTTTFSFGTMPLSTVLETSAVSGGFIEGDPGAFILEKGVCYSTTPGPTTSDNKVQYPGFGSLEDYYEVDITGLSASTTYYIRAYLILSSGGEPGLEDTYYGDELSFTTLSPTADPPALSTSSASSVSASSATIEGVITDDGGFTIIDRGVCWSFYPNPVTADNFISEGAGTGDFTSVLTSLAPDMTYYARAFMIVSQGGGIAITYYGNEQSFTTLSASLPVLNTSAISSVTAYSALSGGDITDDGGDVVTARGICWSLFSNPTIFDNATGEGTGAGSFTSSLTGLSPNTTYYVRAYATNSAGTAYGNEISFTTDVATGIASASLFSGSIYPNPSSGKLNIDLGTYTDTEIEISNARGEVTQKIHPEKSLLVETEIEGPAGLYFVIIYHGEKRSVVKVVKE